MTRPDPDGRAALLAAARAELDARGHAGISLRAIARRAGVSHAAPKYYFPDRAAMLTAIATDGFVALTTALRRTAETKPKDLLGALGRTYIDFGLANPALFDLMFRPSELHPADHDLQLAQHEAINELAEATRGMAGDDRESLTLVSWALAHGLVVLACSGALPSTNPGSSATTARHLARFFAARLHG
jgi:AcrR family transcriptional regulator